VRSRAHFIAWVAALSVVFVLAACGGDDQSSPSSTGPGATTSASSSTSTATTVTVTTVAPSTAPTTAGPTDEAQVRSAFEAFFNGADRNVDKKVALLQDGEKYRQMLVDADADTRSQQLKAQIRSVRFPTAAECAQAGVPSPCAIVNFDLLLGAFPALAAHDGAAVRIAGVWKVSAKAWCDVVAIGGESCPA
jgi:hypothetical protein